MRLGSRLLQLPMFATLILVAVAACSSDDEGTPPPAKTCPNGKIDTGEVCDGTQLGGKTCDTATSGAKPTGTLKCTATCTFDTSGCTAAAGTGGTAGTGATGAGGTGTGGTGTGGSGTGGTNAGGIGGVAGQAGAP